LVLKKLFSFPFGYVADLTSAGQILLSFSKHSILSAGEIIFTSKSELLEGWNEGYSKI